MLRFEPWHYRIAVPCLIPSNMPNSILHWTFHQQMFDGDHGIEGIQVRSFNNCIVSCQDFDHRKSSWIVICWDKVPTFIGNVSIRDPYSTR